MSSAVLCQQCHSAIDWIRTDTYAVGWCQHDVHTECMSLHVRSCRECYPHNTKFLFEHSRNISG